MQGPAGGRITSRTWSPLAPVAPAPPPRPRPPPPRPNAHRALSPSDQDRRAHGSLQADLGARHPSTRRYDQGGQNAERSKASSRPPMLLAHLPAVLTRGAAALRHFPCQRLARRQQYVLPHEIHRNRGGAGKRTDRPVVATRMKNVPAAARHCRSCHPARTRQLKPDECRGTFPSPISQLRQLVGSHHQPAASGHMGCGMIEKTRW